MISRPCAPNRPRTKRCRMREYSRPGFRRPAETLHSSGHGTPLVEVF